MAEKNEKDSQSKMAQAGISISFDDMDLDPVDNKQTEKQSIAQHKQTVIKDTTKKPQQKTPVNKTKPKTNDNLLTDFNDAPDSSILIKFFDQTSNLSRVKTLMGPVGTTSSYNVQDDINSYLVRGYELVNNEIGNNNLTFNKDNKTYLITFKHKTEKVERTKTVTETIKYSKSDGSKAPQSQTQTLIFTQEGQKDLVTNRTTWPNGIIEKEFKAVKTPELDGYHADIANVNAIKVSVDSNNFNSDLDVTRLINYLADQQTIIVEFIDETSDISRKKTLRGFTNQMSGYYASDTIDQFINRGYELVKDETDGQELKFNDQTNINQEYKIILKHKTKLLTPNDSYNPVQDEDEIDNLTHDVNRIIEFNTPDSAQKIKPIKQIAKFERSAKLDLVTGQINYLQWSDKQTLPAINMPLIEGYISIPDQIKSTIVDENSENINITVNYKPENKTIKVIYYDDVLDKTVKALTLNGKSDENSHYLTANHLLELQKNGYTVLNDETNGQELIFDPTLSNQKYTILLGHNQKRLDSDNPINPVTKQNLSNDLTHTVFRTIEYTTPDGVDNIKAKTQSLTFTRRATVDMITGDITYSNWSDDQTFESIESPRVKGYQPSVKEVKSETVSGKTQNKQIKVIYSPAMESVVLTVFDQTINKAILTKKLTGRTNTIINFNKQKLLHNLIKKGYDVINDTFNITKYPIESLTKVQITVKHAKQQLTVQDSINPVTQDNEIDHLTQTRHIEIKYTYKNGIQAFEPETREIKSERTGIVDMVTGNIKYDDWKQVNTIKDVIAPTLTDYTAFPSKISANELIKSNNNVINITYLINLQTVDFDFVANETTVGNKTISLKLNDDKAVSTKSVINEIEKDGYALDPDQDYPEKVTYDKNINDNRKFVIKVHETFIVSTDHKDLVRQILIENPDKSVRSVLQTAYLRRKITTSRATGNVEKGKWSTNIWDPYIPATVPGFKATPNSLEQKIVNGSTESEVVHIHYEVIPQAVTANADRVHKLTFIDKLKKALHIGTYEQNQLPEPNNNNSEQLVDHKKVTKDDQPKMPTRTSIRLNEAKENGK